MSSILIAAVVVAFFFLNDAKSPAPSLSADPGVIRIGTTTWPGYFAFYVARDKGYFKEAGLNVEIKRYDSQAECSWDYVAGKLEARTNLTSETIGESLHGFDQKIVLVIDYSNGSDAIMAVPDIRDFHQIRGKRVAYEFGTMEEYFLRYALEVHEMALDDVVPMNLNPGDAARAVVEGKADVAVTFEPFLSQAVKVSGGNVIFSSADAPGAITDILTFPSEFIAKYPEAVDAIVRVYFKAVRLWREHPDEANAINAREHGVTPEEIAQQMRGITILDEDANEMAFTFAAGLQSLYGNLRQMGDFMLRQLGKSEADLDTDKLIEKKFIRGLSDRRGRAKEKP